MKWAAFVLPVALAATTAAGAMERPSSYSEFHVASDADSLVAALSSRRAVYVPPGRYEIDNPIVVDRDGPLFLHGGNRRATSLVPRNPGRPLFVVRRATLVNLSNLRLAPAGGAGGADSVALVAENREEVVVEIQECTIDDGSVQLRGPGRFHLQATTFHPQGRVRAALVVDHPDARTVVVGGNISNGRNAPVFPDDQAHHIWQKRGRLRVYGTGLQAALGRADIRIDSPSLHGPHLISHVRSEGNNGARKGAFPSVLLLVPPSSSQVDVLVESSSGSWGSQGPGRGRLVDYSAAGTVWLVGNNAAMGASRLVTGDLSRASIVALGNAYHGASSPLPDGSARALEVGNLGYVGRAPSHPIRTLRHAAGVPGANAPKAELARLPHIEPPGPLTRPVLEAALPGMRSVIEFGARGDGVHDDTAAIQKALDAGCGLADGKMLYFPAGTYRVTRRLLFNHREAGCTSHRSGGWLAGAGSGRSVLQRTGAGGVFASQGIAQTTVQGLTFRTSPFRTGPSTAEPAFSLENDPGVGHATQGVTFSDVVFDGGRQGLGVGLESQTNCSENLLVDSVFRNAHVGLGIGSYNALANLVLRGRFEDNDVAMGHDAEALSGGTWGVWGAEIRGTRHQDVALRNSAGGVWVLAGVDSDSHRLLSTGVTGAIFPLLVQDSRWRDASALRLEFAAGGGPIFLRSVIPRLELELRSPLVDNFALRLGGEIGGWGPDRAGHSLVWSAHQAAAQN